MQALMIEMGSFGKVLFNGLPLVFEAMFLMFIAKMARNVFTPFDDNRQLFDDDNPAMGIPMAGYYLGVLVAITGVLAGASKGLVQDLVECLIFGVLAIALLNVARMITDATVLHKFNLNKELTEDKNQGTSWALFGIYVGLGFVIRGAVMGDSTSILAGIGTTLFFFILSQVAFVVAAAIYQVMTPYDFHEQIESDNVAAGIGFGGYMAALGMIIGNAGGDQVTIAHTVVFFAWVVMGFLVLAVARWLLAERILTPNHKIKDEIVRDRNVNAGWILVAAYITVAQIVVNAV